MIASRRSRRIFADGPPADLLWNQQQWRSTLALLIRRIEARIDRIGIPRVPRRREKIARFAGTEYDAASFARTLCYDKARPDITNIQTITGVELVE
jgi:hypothetical protein